MAEVVATSALKASEGFTRPMPSLITAVSYALAFYCLSHTLKSIPTGVAYALWSGVGIVLISAVGWLWLGQRLDAPALLGLGLIIAGAGGDQCVFQKHHTLNKSCTRFIYSVFS